MILITLSSSLPTQTRLQDQEKFSNKHRDQRFLQATPTAVTVDLNNKATQQRQKNARREKNMTDDSQKRLKTRKPINT